MLHKILLASAGTIALASQAFAADLPSRAPPPVYVPPAPVFTWTGFYLGAQVGYAWGNVDANLFTPIGGLSNSFTAEGVIGGGHIGYNYQVNQWVIGIEGTVDGTSLSKTFTPRGDIFPGLPGFGASLNASIPIQGSIRGRLGVAWDRVLLYATGGVAFAGLDLDLNTTVGSFSRSTTRVGWTVGGGLEYSINNNWSVGVEYRYSDFGSNSTDLGGLFAVAGVPGTATISREYTQNQVQGRLTYHFTPPPAPVIAKY